MKKTILLFLVGTLLSTNSSFSIAALKKTELPNGDQLDNATVEPYSIKVGECATTSPLMIFGGDHDVDERKKTAANHNRIEEERRQYEERRLTDNEALPSEEEAISIEQQFKDAIIAHPDAPRIIVQEGTIVPQNENIAGGNNDRENQQTMRLLKNVITVRYSLEVANSIPELTLPAFVSAKNLSAKTIGEIFDKANVPETTSQNNHQVHFSIPRLRGGGPMNDNQQNNNNQPTTFTSARNRFQAVIPAWATLYLSFNGLKRAIEFNDAANQATNIQNLKNSLDRGNKNVITTALRNINTDSNALNSALNAASGIVQSVCNETRHLVNNNIFNAYQNCRRDIPFYEVYCSQYEQAIANAQRIINRIRNPYLSNLFKEIIAPIPHIIESQNNLDPSIELLYTTQLLLPRNTYYRDQMSTAIRNLVNINKFFTNERTIMNADARLRDACIVRYGCLNADISYVRSTSSDCIGIEGLTTGYLPTGSHFGWDGPQSQKEFIRRVTKTNQKMEIFNNNINQHFNF